MAAPSTYFTPRYVNTRPVNYMRPKARAPADIQSSMNSVLNTMHRRMKPATTTPPARPWKSEIKLDPVPMPEVVLVSKGIHKKKTGNKTAKSKTTLSIPQIKAQLHGKSQQMLRISNAAGSYGPNNYTNQQRIKEVLRQRRLLEEMMTEYKKLQRDRQSVAMEIQSMRAYLNDIRDKVDGSLRKLNTKRPICDRVSPPQLRSTSMYAYPSKAAMAPPSKSRLNIKKPAVKKSALPQKRK